MTDPLCRFWGVFWIDGRSRELLKQTLSQNVARIAGVDTNERAAMHWLSNLEERWLLIIDNADDPRIDLNDYLPRGSRGFVLITTRNPMIKSFGNVGQGHFQFHGLKNEEAVTLLLRSADQSHPTDSTIVIQITKALGYLALAIAVAGGAIREGFCRLETYLQYHEAQRQKRPRRKGSQEFTRIQEEPDDLK